VLPFVNSALASRAPFKQSVKSLRAEGVSILLGRGAIEPYEPDAYAQRRFKSTRASATRDEALQISPSSII
jgi:hypothetical protein